MPLVGRFPRILLLCAMFPLVPSSLFGAVLYHQDFRSGFSGWWVGPPAHRPYVTLALDSAVGGLAPPSLRLDLPPATLNTYLSSPTIPLPHLDQEYTVEFRLRVQEPDCPFEAEVVLMDSLGQWIERRTFLELVGEDMQETRAFRYSFRLQGRSGPGQCRFNFGVPYLKAFREGRFWIDDLELRTGHEAEALELYLRPASVAAGGSVDVHLSCGRGHATLRVLREADRQVEVSPPTELRGLAAYPTPPDAFRNGCRWPVATTIPIGRDWVPGVYVVKIDDGDRVAWAPFVVQGRGGEGPVLIDLPTHTDQAYNGYGGFSFYTGPPSPEVSFDRPTPSSLYVASIHLIRWLCREGIGFAVATDDDLHFHPEMLYNYPGLILTWHGEYWTRAMREGVEDYVRSGGSVLCLSGNTCWWQTRVEGSSGLENAQPVEDPEKLICYKYSASEDPCWGTDPALVTTHWDEPPLNDPPTRFLGLSWREGGMVNWSTSSACPCAWDWLLGYGGYAVMNSGHWAYAGTGLADRDQVGRTYAVVGYEVDGAPVRWNGDQPEIDRSGGTPTGFSILGYARCFNEYRPDSTGVALMGILERESSFVFNGGTTGWCWGLPHDTQVQTITRNLIQRLAAKLPPALPPPTLTAYPNPARDRLEVILYGAPPPQGIDIFDLQGRLVLTLTAHRAITWNFQDRDGHDLPSGAYWISVPGREPVRVVRVR